jgi:hypothetical protein
MIGSDRLEELIMTQEQRQAFLGRMRVQVSPEDYRASSKPLPPTHEQLVAVFPQLEILVGQGRLGFAFKARQPKSNA